MSKLISKALPPSWSTREEAEEHFWAVHLPAAQDYMRRIKARRIYANIARKQYSATGQFNMKPRGAWLWTLAEFNEDGMLEETASGADDAAPGLVADHGNFCGIVWRSDVEPTIEADRRSGQTSLVKFLFELDRPAELPLEEARRHYEEEHLPALKEALEVAFGFRLLQTNLAISNVTVPMERPGATAADMGQLPSSGGTSDQISAELPETEKFCFQEIYFDNLRWGEEFFTRLDIRRLLDAGPLRIQGYLVEERFALDNT